MTAIRFKSLSWSSSGPDSVISKVSRLGLSWKVTACLSAYLSADLNAKPVVEFSAQRIRDNGVSTLLHQGGDLCDAIAVCEGDFIKQTLDLIKELSGSTVNYEQGEPVSTPGEPF